MDSLEAVIGAIGLQRSIVYLVIFVEVRNAYLLYNAWLLFVGSWCSHVATKAK